jgi:hemolysin D
MSTLPLAAKPPSPPSAKTPAKVPALQVPRRIKLNHGDHEFLPAALEILETPLSPVRSGMILTICAFVTAALVWSWFGRVDIIATAQGKIQPVGRTKTVQPLETGKVLSIAVQNGAHVKAGDVLVTLDPGEAQADEGTLQADINAEKAEVLRRTTALTLASRRALGAVPQIAFPPGIPPEIAAREQRVLAQDITQLATTVGSLDGQVKEKSAERDRLKSTIDAQQALVATLKERVDMRQTLEASRSESRAKVIDALELMQTQQATLASEKGQIGEADASLARLQRDIEKSYATFAADNAQKLADADRLMSSNNEKLAKARLKTDHMTLRSPVDGTVAGSTITSLEQVVTVGEQVMQIVPDDSRLEIECYLPNSDIGFVRKDQQAVVKIESFPFTDYGTIDAEVVRVAHDAIPQPDADQREQNPVAASKDVGMFGGGQRFQNLVYPVTLTMDRKVMKSEGAEVPLVPGMAVTVEIKTGTRRILSYLFSPILQVATTAFRER